MGRRFSILNMMALAVVGVGLALGAGPAPSPQSSPKPLGKPAATAKSVVPKAKANAAPAESEEPPAGLSPGFMATEAPAGKAPDVGPEPPSFGPRAPVKKDAKVARTAGDPEPPVTPVTVPAQEMPASALPPAESLPPPETMPAPVGLDPALEKSQASGTAPAAGGRAAGAPAPAPLPASTPVVADPANLPGAGGGAPLPTASGPLGDKPAFVLAPEEVPLGRQSVGLTVDVIAPQYLNINQTATLKVVVKNNGMSDAKGVAVRDELPEGLTYVASQPEAQRTDALLVWGLGTIAAGSERTITLSVKPTRTGAFDHAATVTMMAGGKSRTMVREPKLKVEQTAVSQKVLRGQPAQFKIAVSNPGDGPARNVTIQAKLSPGLRHESGEPNDQNLFEQTFDLINPGERVVLDTLVADAIQGGEQFCLIVATSADVTPGAAESRSQANLTVVEPKLKLAVAGPDKRFTDMLATYDLTLENPGTAPARNVRVQATLPVSGRLKEIPPGAQFDKQTRRLAWSIPQLEAGGKSVLSFQVRMGGIGLYQVAVESRGEGGLLAKEIIATDVSGLAVIDFNVSEKRRVVDVNEGTTYVIHVVNSGSKEATRILISAELSKNIDPIDTSGTKERAKFNPGEHKLVFPPIERLGPDKSVDLGIRVKAIAPGIATCRVFLLHDDLTEKLDDVAAFKVTPVRR